LLRPWAIAVDDEDEDAGIATRNDRYLPAYVRVVAWIEEVEARVGGPFCLEAIRGGSVDIEGEDVRFGREEVRSMRCSRGEEWLSTEDSVLERPNIRFASFVGVPAGDIDGEIESKIPERSRTGLSPFDGVGKSSFGGAPYDIIILGLTGVESSTSVAAFSVLVGDGVRATRTRRRFKGLLLRTSGSDTSVTCFLLTPSLFPYVLGLLDIDQICEELLHASAVLYKLACLQVRKVASVDSVRRRGQVT
jgi:hypothetical protein